MARSAAGFVRCVRPDGSVVCERCLVAARPLRRMRGRLGRRDLPQGEGILLKPAGSIHTFFMCFPIDVVFLDREQVVLRIAHGVPAWRALGERGTRSVLELRSGEAARSGAQVGERLELVDQTALVPPTPQG